MAEQFYDVSNPAYRALHVKYIKKCLDNFSDNSNVIHFISAEYTGPLSFMQFWLDVISEWESETGKNALIALSATKDVQDAILRDPIRSKVVDIIDIQYWWYGESKTGNIEEYAPKGGKNLAPRQHARLVKTPKETFESTYKAISEYSLKYPNMAVIMNTPRASAFGWAALMAGGSLMNLPKVDHISFFEDAAQMKPTQFSSCYQLLNAKNGEQIFCLKDQSKVKIDLSAYRGNFELYWLNIDSGKAIKSNVKLKGGEVKEIELKSSQILWVHLKE
jgi:hypothetical protein